MKKDELKDYQIKTSRTGEPVPVVNGIHLHSVYDPEKEAKGLAQNNIKIIKKNSNILILGLGFAYHVQTIIEELKKYHKNPKVIVIESNNKIFDDCNHYKIKNCEGAAIYVESNIDKLYSNIELVDFLSERPGVIAHPASFNLNDKFFRNFLTYKADQKFGSLINNFHEDSLIKLSSIFDEDRSLSINLEQYLFEKNKVTNELDHFLLAYKELVKSKESYLGKDI